MSGTLHLVGVGPGDPELLTLKAARVLAAADVIAYPVSNEDTTVALDIARLHCNPAAILEGIRIPMTVPLPRGEMVPKQAIYDEACARLAAHLDSGRDVAYLCEGDPLFYGTAIYLLGHFHDTPQRVAVVPGITSITAAAAAIPFPLVAKAENLTILTGLLPDDVLREELGQGGSFAILKLGRHYDRVRALLDEAGLSEDAWYVERASAPDQRVARVKDLLPGEKPYFSLILSYSGAEHWL
jgi:precorrin-2/cobalt-factor-2 C20-methyltransferase